MNSQIIRQNIEALLFIATRPLTSKKLASLIGSSDDAVTKELDALAALYRVEKRGILIIKVGSTYQMTTSKEASHVVSAYTKEEVSGELTKPSLEALTIIAYRGPVNKAEIEQIRGVNCSVILRNLLIRGLIEQEVKKGDVSEIYRITTDFLKYIGLSSVQELPEYESLSSSVSLERFLEVSNKVNE